MTAEGGPSGASLGRQAETNPFPHPPPFCCQSLESRKAESWRRGRFGRYVASFQVPNPRLRRARAPADPHEAGTSGTRSRSSRDVRTQPRPDGRSRRCRSPAPPHPGAEELIRVGEVSSHHERSIRVSPMWVGTRPQPGRRPSVRRTGSTELPRASGGAARCRASLEQTRRAGRGS